MPIPAGPAVPTFPYFPSLNCTDQKPPPCHNKRMSQTNSRQEPPITVRTPGASYPILIEEGLLSRAGKVLESLSANRKVILLSDTTVWKLWGNKLLAGLKPLRPVHILIPAGEKYKRLATVETITNQLSAAGAERSSLLVAFGGGVVGDVGGVVAAGFFR